MELPHQALGYDRAITTFAPDGRILQVEYAKQAARQGSTAIGIVTKDGIVILADKKIPNKLVISNSIEKIFKIDEHIAATFAGFISDGRVLIERARIIAQEHRVIYGTKIDVKSLVKDIADYMQIFTQYGGLRPFGVTIIFAGINEDGSKELFMIEPSGAYFQYRAAVIGEGETKIWSILEKEYKDDISLEEGIKLALKALKEALGKEFDVKRVDGAVITKEGIRILKTEELEKWLKDLKKQ